MQLPEQVSVIWTVLFTTFSAMEDRSAPLADYFWIAGIDSLSYHDFSPPNASHSTPNSQSVSAIEEDIELDNSSIPLRQNVMVSHSRQSSMNRISKHSSFQQESDQDVEYLGSNRSSATIKVSSNSLGNTKSSYTGNNNGIGDFDFDRALLTFANERDLFLDDLSFSAGAQIQKPMPMTELPSKVTERIQRREGGNAGNSLANKRRSPLKEMKGSIRRHISYRDMNRVKKIPSSMQRNGTSYQIQNLNGYSGK